MVRLGYWGPKVCECLHLPRLSTAALLVLKKGKNNPKERDLPRRDQGYTGSFSHLRAIQPDNEPVDPATKQNHSGFSGRDIDEFRIWEFWTLDWDTTSLDSSGSVSLD